MLDRLVPIAVVFALFLTAYAAGPREFKIDNNHSTVGFSVPILGGLSQVKGKFMSFDIDLRFDEKDVTKSSVKAVIKASSVDTGIEGRDKHLRTADFFDVEKYPEITFQSSRVRKSGKGFVATGDLTMHGVTKQIDLPFTITGKVKKDGATTAGFRAHTTLNRRDYGVNYTNKNTPNFVGDTIDIDIDIITRPTQDQ